MIGEVKKKGGNYIAIKRYRDKEKKKQSDRMVMKISKKKRNYC